MPFTCASCYIKMLSQLYILHKRLRPTTHPFKAINRAWLGDILLEIAQTTPILTK